MMMTMMTQDRLIEKERYNSLLQQFANYYHKKQYADAYTTLTDIAILFEKSDLRYAKKYYELSLAGWERISEQSLGKDDLIGYVDTLNGFGNLYSRIKDFSNAESKYKKALSISARIDNIEYAKTLNNLGSMYRNKEDLFKSIDVYIEASKVWDKISTKQNHLEYARLLNNHAVSLHMVHQYKESLRLYKESLEIFKRIRTNPAEYARLLGNVAILHKHLKNFEEARNVTNLALDLLKGEHEFEEAYIDCLLYMIEINASRWKFRRRYLYRSI